MLSPCMHYPRPLPCSIQSIRLNWHKGLYEAIIYNMSTVNRMSINKSHTHEQAEHVTTTHNSDVLVLYNGPPSIPYMVRGSICWVSISCH